MLTITARRLYTPIEEIDLPVLSLDGGRIFEITSRREREVPIHGTQLDFGDAVLAPAFMDLHIHGGMSFDCMDDDPRALPAIEKLLAKHGVGSYFPTTVTAPIDYTLRAIERLANAIEASADDRDGARACPLGIHLEGPFISHRRRGVHPEGELLRPDLKIFERLWEAARGKIKILTMAPELEGALELISVAVRRGVCVSLGHTDADFATARRAVDFGARHATHTFNAMRPLLHRDPGVLGEVLADDRVSADIIADGIHLDPSIIQLFLSAKGSDRAVLITDAMAATGMPEGRYHLGAFEVEVHDGRCTVNGGTLAGSVLTLDRAVRNVMKYAGWDLASSVRLASANPAAVAGIATKGRLQPGSDADLVVLDGAGNVIRTILGGKVSEPN